MLHGATVPNGLGLDAMYSIGNISLGLDATRLFSFKPRYRETTDQDPRLDVNRIIHCPEHITTLDTNT